MTTEDREQRRKKRGSILNKVRALLAKTVENGATEAEAIAAAEKAASMMADHDLSMDEIDVKESGVKREEFDLDKDMATYLGIVAEAIANLNGTRFWTDYIGRSANSGTFYGLPHDVEISLHLFAVCKSAMERAVKAYERDPEIALKRITIRAAKRRSFLGGMSDRLAERLNEMAASRRRGTGTAIVPLKDAVIDAAMKDDDIKLKSGRLRFGDLHTDDIRRGRLAGDKVALDPALRGNESPEQIS